MDALIGGTLLQGIVGGVLELGMVRESSESFERTGVWIWAEENLYTTGTGHLF